MGVVQLSATLFAPGAAARFVTAGRWFGSTGDPRTAFEAGPVPAAFVVATLTEYEVPFASPPIVNDDAGAVTVDVITGPDGGVAVTR